MRELTLQKRLGHASLESTRRYTRVSEQVVVAEYRRALGFGSVVGADSGVSATSAQEGYEAQKVDEDERGNNR